MDLPTLTTFFQWCTVLNGGLLILWAVLFFLVPDFIYRLHSKWFPIPRESYNMVIYSLLGIFKILFLVLNLVPYLALLIMQ